MRNLFILLAMVLMNLNAEAGSGLIGPGHYAVEFELTSFGPICPRPLPGRVSCMAIGNVARISAPLRGCLDKVVYSDFKQKKQGKHLTIIATGIAKVDPKSETARCIRQNIYTQSITIPNDISSVDVINDGLAY
jgi:hypothetical protein